MASVRAQLELNLGALEPPAPVYPPILAIATPLGSPAVILSSITLSAGGAQDVSPTLREMPEEPAAKPSKSTRPERLQQLLDLRADPNPDAAEIAARDPLEFQFN
jgi:hypothetical protein